jgi:hypothetical protein
MSLTGNTIPANPNSPLGLNPITEGEDQGGNGEVK